MGSFPEGLTLPVSTSAMEFPPSSPGSQAQRIASGRSFQDAVSTGPQILSTTTTFLPRAWNSSQTVSRRLSSSSCRRNSLLRMRSRASPDIRPRVIRATSLALALALMSGRVISNSGFWASPTCTFTLWLFFRSSEMKASYPLYNFSSFGSSSKPAFCRPWSRLMT